MDADSASGQVVVYYGTCGLFAMQKVKLMWADGAMQVISSLNYCTPSVAGVTIST